MFVNRGMGGTSNSHKSPRDVGGWKALTTLSLKIGVNRSVPCMVLKGTAMGRHHLCHDDFRGPRSGLCRSGVFCNNKEKIMYKG
ncbi:hypothetical protein TNCV_3732241 [Trichonephila clavipes]|nr:hypothetical protein TNCV_3732241 [Trichonephila clavipes]